jgi:hypothetical protein
MGTDRMTVRHAYHKPFMVKFTDKHEWQYGFNAVTYGGCSGMWMGPRPIKALMLGSIGGGFRKGHNFSVGLQNTAFQGEICAIKACIMENIE